MAQSMENCYNHEWEVKNETAYLSNFPLHKACRDGDIHTVSLLIGTGCHSPCEEDSTYGWTPAHWASYFGHLDCLRKVLTMMPTGSSVDLTSSRYIQCPSHNAAFAGHPHCLLWLLQSGGNINMQDHMKETPLHKASRAGNMECVSLLAATGANVLLPNCDGNTAAKLALLCGHHAIAAYLTQAELARGSPAALSGLNGFNIIQPSMLNNGLNGGLLPSTFGMKSLPANFVSRDFHFNAIPSQPLFTIGSFTVGEKGLNGTSAIRRKRSFHFGENDEVKRVRIADPSGTPGFDAGPMINGTFHVSMTPVPMVTCSVMEHESLRTVEEGYNHALLERIISQVHGC